MKIQKTDKIRFTRNESGKRTAIIRQPKGAIAKRLTGKSTTTTLFHSSAEKGMNGWVKVVGQRRVGVTMAEGGILDRKYQDAQLKASSQNWEKQWCR